MLVHMVHVRHVRMRVSHWAVLMEMRVRLARRVQRTVRMLMMRVVHMRVCVRHRLVNVLMLMAFGEMQPYPRRHERARDDELRRHRLAEYHNRNRTAEKRCGGKIGAGARGPKMAQGDDKERQAHAISEKSDDAREGDSRDVRERCTD